MDQPMHGRRLIRFWRLTLKSFLVLVLLSGVMAVGARVPDQYICVQMTNFTYQRPIETGLVDLNTGDYMPDARLTNPMFGINSPDNHYTVSYQPDRPNAQTNSLIIQRADLSSASVNNAMSVVIQQGIFSANSVNGGFNRFGQALWSTDSHKLMYLWSGEDRQMHVSVVNADGSDKRTGTYPHPISTSTSTVSISPGNWSADNTYFTIGERDTRSSNAVTTYTLWSASDVHAADPNRSPLQIGTWSPQGHQLAGLSQDRYGDSQLILWSPEGETKTPLHFTSDQDADRFSWSPDSRYIVLQSHRPVYGHTSTSSRIFDVFDKDGKLLAGNIAGGEWDSSGGGARPAASWTEDGATWVFLQANTDSTVDDLVALHVAENRYQTLASDIPAELASDMFYTPPFFRRSGFFFGGADAPVDHRIVIPTSRDGKITVELADLDGKNRTTLVSGADRILATTSIRRNTSRFWTADGRIALVAWVTTNADGTESARLTWANADGSALHVIDDGLQNIVNMQTIQGLEAEQQWLGYLATRDGKIGVEIAELGTGQHHWLAEVDKDTDNWVVRPAPDQHLGYLQVGTFYSSLSNPSRLYLMSMDGQSVRLVGDTLSTPPIWSPDSSMLAVLLQNNSTSALQIVKANGEQLQTIPLPELSSSSRLRLNGWTKCN